MIKDPTQQAHPTPRDWAVFRYTLISGAVRPLEGQVVHQILAGNAARQHQLPDGSVRRYNVSTLRLWLRKYLEGGLDDLMPKERSDKGTFRSIDDDTAEAIARYRVQHRQVSVKLFWEMLHEDEVLGPGVKIPQATLRRFLAARGLARKKRGPAKARAKYEMPHANDLWVADFMHGPKILTEERRRKAILCAIIDDHSRVVVGGRFSLSEEMADMLHTLSDAILTYGVPKRLYCDNGSAFNAHHLKEACGRIGCSLLHSDPYDSPSRGKIERFNRTVRQRFIPRLNEQALESLDDLNCAFDHWLRQDYHLRRHGGIKMKPLDRYLTSAEETRITRLSEQEVDHAFMGRITRVVRNDATVKINNQFYEVPPEFIGARCDLRFPIASPDKIYLYRDDKRVTRVKPVDLADNARFHATRVSATPLEQER